MEQERQSDRILAPVLQDEMKAILARRKKIKPDSSEAFPDDLFGIALSGGGIRSATINLGILEVLNKCGILQLADYLSTVSGGGYIGGYVHATLNKDDCSNRSNDAGQHGLYARLFHEDHIEHFKKYGYYLAPGTKWVKFFNRLRLAPITSPACSPALLAGLLESTLVISTPLFTARLYMAAIPALTVCSDTPK